MDLGLHLHSEVSPDDKDLVDRISALPDALLDIILSRLSVNEAQATSILARRWRHLWCFITTLNFQDNNIFIGRASSKIYCYVNWVDSVLVRQHRGQIITWLRVYAHLPAQYTSCIQNWVRFAAGKGFQNVEFILLKNVVNARNEIRAAFDFLQDSDQVMEDKKEGSAGLQQYLCSEPVSSFHPRRFGANSCFKYLKDIHFRFVKLSEGVVECFLSNCPQLERVTVFGCNVVGSFRCIGPSVAVKYLRVEDTGVEIIEIINVNLFSFDYRGERKVLLLRDVPRLVHVSIVQARRYSNVPRVFSLSRCLSQLESIKYQLEVLKLNGSMLYNQKAAFPTFTNLKHLDLEFDQDDNDSCPLYLASFIKASPCLHKLVLKLRRIISTSYRREKQINQAAKCSHHYLRVVEVAGYHGRTSDFELVMYLIENALGLEKLVIHPVQDWCQLRKSGLNTEKEEEEERKHVRHQLEERVPSTVEFVCHLYSRPLATELKRTPKRSQAFRELLPSCFDLRLYIHV